MCDLGNPARDDIAFICIIKIIELDFSAFQRVGTDFERYTLIFEIRAVISSLALPDFILVLAT